MNKPLNVEKKEWHGQIYIGELYASDSFAGDLPISQVQAVCLTDDSKIVLRKNTDGQIGLPGARSKMARVWKTLCGGRCLRRPISSYLTVGLLLISNTGLRTSQIVSDTMLVSGPGLESCQVSLKILTARLFRG